MTDYAHGLLGCCSDCGIMIYGLFCMPCRHGSNVALARDESCGCCHVINCYSEYYIRKDIGKKEGFESSNLCDCLTSILCAPCLVCQNARYLEENKAIVEHHEQHEEHNDEN